MNSKEALDNLVHCKSITKCKECRHKDLCTMERDYNIIKQDLDRLEQLEKENKELIRTQNVLLLNSKDYILKNMELEKKYQKLEETFKKRAELCSELGEYIGQYEKALDFLMDKFKLKLKSNRLYYLNNNQYFELDKDIEKLIKEVFGYE